MGPRLRREDAQSRYAVSCDCLTEINERVKEQTGDSEAYIDFAFTMSGKSFPRIPYNYRKKKRDGTFHAKESEGTIIPTFCPWCGVKYNGGMP